MKKKAGCSAVWPCSRLSKWSPLVKEEGCLDLGSTGTPVEKKGTLFLSGLFACRFKPEVRVEELKQNQPQGRGEGTEQQNPDEHIQG